MAEPGKSVPRNGHGSEKPEALSDPKKEAGKYESGSDKMKVAIELVLMLAHVKRPESSVSCDLATIGHFFPFLSEAFLGLLGGRETKAFPRQEKRKGQLAASPA